MGLGVGAGGGPSPAAARYNCGSPMAQQPPARLPLARVPGSGTPRGAPRPGGAASPGLRAAACALGLFAAFVGGPTPPLEGQARDGATPSAPRSPGVQSDPDSLVRRALEDEFALLEARFQAQADDADALSLAVETALSLSVVGRSHSARRRWAARADTLGRRLLALRPGDPEALARAAAGRGRRALHEDGARASAALAQEAWDLTEAVLALRPGDALANHVRGKLHQHVSGLPRAQRLLGRLVLGARLLGQVTWDLAEEHHRRAVEAAPEVVYFYLDLGDTYRSRGKVEEAAAAYRRGLSTPDRYTVDPALKRRLAERLAALEGAPRGA